MSDKKCKWCFVSMDVQLNALKRVNKDKSVNQVTSGFKMLVGIQCLDGNGLECPIHST